MPKVSQDHLDARREQILAGARRVFARHGYRGATVARLEKEIGLSRGAIFNYFDSKWALFEALAAGDTRRYRELAVEHGLDELIRQVDREHPDWLGVHLEAMHVIRTDPEIRERALTESEDLAGILRSIEDSQREGVLRADVPVRDLARFLSIVLDGLALRVSLGLPVEIESLLSLVHGGIDGPGS